MIQDTIATYEEAMAKETALDQVRKLQEQMDKIKDQAKEEALEQAQAAVETLNSLGFNYTLSQGQTVKKGKAQGQRKSPSGVCPVCDYLTDPPHDGRKHRGRDKRPFNKEELLELGLRRVD